MSKGQYNELAEAAYREIESIPLLRLAGESVKRSFAQSVAVQQRKNDEEERRQLRYAIAYRNQRRIFGLYLQGWSYQKIGRSIGRHSSVAASNCRKFLRRFTYRLRLRQLEGDNWSACLTSLSPHDWRIKRA